MPGDNAGWKREPARFLWRIRTLFSAVRVEMSDRSSQNTIHFPAAPSRFCNNVKSKRQPTKRCRNPATHGDQCGLHYKHPVLFGDDKKPPRKLNRKLNRLSQKKAEEDALGKIGRWIRTLPRHHKTPVNDTDFFSMEPLSELSPEYFISYPEANQIYGFDLRSLHTIAHQEPPLNPYTRSPIPASVLDLVRTRVAALEARGLPVRWTPLDPPTPEQQARMRIVDLFLAINDLNYYSTPEWYFAMDAAAHRRYYAELHSIWALRAGLTEEQKERIVPDHRRRLFRIISVAELTVDEIARLNASTMRMFVSSAVDKNDRIVGAMYVVSALTLVNREAKEAYPWLYESVYEPPPVSRFGWLQRLFRIRNLPFLEIPLREEE